MFLAFLLTSVVLAVTPGPGVVYVVARTAAQGRQAGLASVAGVALGNLANAIAASLGLAAILATSAAAFTVVKLAGAAYLIFLGLQALRRTDAPAPPPAFGAPLLGRIFRDGFAISLLNPKTALFFAAFLPQFIDAGRSASAQGMWLAGVFVLVAALTDTAYVFAANAARRRLGDGSAARRLGRCMTAATYLGLGLFVAVSDSRGTR